MRRTWVVAICIVSVLCSAGMALLPDHAEGAASADRNVLFELFTATWCVGCPYADAAADQLKAEYGERVSVLQYHVQEQGISSPFFDTIETNSRAANYSVAPLPDLWVDGVVSSSGASSTSEAHANYKSILDSRLAQDAQLELGISGATLGSGKLTVNAELSKTDSLEQSSFNVVFAVYENKLTYEKGILNYVVRDIAVQSVSASSLPASLSQDLIYNTTWKFDNMGAVVFAQVGDAGEVLQSHSMSFGTEDEDYDGLPDDWELLKLGTLLYSGEDDPDGDGITNIEEYMNRTDPLVKNSDTDIDFSPFIIAAAVAVMVILILTFIVVYLTGRKGKSTRRTREIHRDAVSGTEDATEDPDAYEEDEE